jgi:hypothetical protein
VRVRQGCRLRRWRGRRSSGTSSSAEVAAPRRPTATRCVRAFARFLAWVPGVACGGFGAVFVSGADGHRISLPHFAYRWVPGALLACLLSLHGLTCKDALLHCVVGLYKSLLLLLLIGRIRPWLDCSAEVTACRVSPRLGPR